MEPLSSLHLLTEAVRNAGADIAPTYQEYIQLAFAIATDCGEAGRQDFLTLCSLSSKYDHQAAEVFQAFCSDEPGASEDSEEVSG